MAILSRACGFDMALLVGRLVFAVGEVTLVGFTAKVYDERCRQILQFFDVPSVLRFVWIIYFSSCLMSRVAVVHVARVLV